jgi:hypothetical protein
MKLLKKFESYSQEREEMCQYLCGCGYSQEELNVCSEEELRQMCRNHEEENYNNEEETLEESKKSKNSEIDSELQALRGKDKDPKKKGVQGLDKKDLKKYKQLNLAKSKSVKEHQEQENYMFFGNLKTIKRLVDEMLEMDESEVDSILSNGHGWATDHIATSKDDVEEVFNFLAGHEKETSHFMNDPVYGEEQSHEETEDHLDNDLEQEIKGIKNFNSFK